MNLAHNWENRAVVPAKRISSMNKPLLHMISKEIRPIIAELNKKMHLKTVKGQFKGYFESSHEPVRCWEEHGTHIESLIDTVLGGMKPSEFKKTINDSTIGKLNKYLEILHTYITDEIQEKHSGAEIIADRLVFAAENYKPIKQLRDAWAAEASTWFQQYTQVKRSYTREVEAAQAAEARAAEAGTSASGAAPPAKRMRVRIAQTAKQHNPGSLTVKAGDMCRFVETATNPLWTRVKMDDDGRVGFVSTSRVRVCPYASPAKLHALQMCVSRHAMHMCGNTHSATRSKTSVQQESRALIVAAGQRRECRRAQATSAASQAC